MIISGLPTLSCQLYKDACNQSVGDFLVVAGSAVRPRKAMFLLVCQLLSRNCLLLLLPLLPGLLHFVVNA